MQLLAPIETIGTAGWLATCGLPGQVLLALVSEFNNGKQENKLSALVVGNLLAIQKMMRS